MSQRSKIWGYLRVSTDRQDAATQRREIEIWAGGQKVYWIEDVASGKKAIGDRELGSTIAGKVLPGETLAVTELSRLGRNFFEVTSFLHWAMQQKIRVVVVRNNREFSDNLESQVFAFAFGLAAQLERDLISERTRAALARKRAEGVMLGRPPGATSIDTKLDPEIENIRKMTQAGVSVASLARMFNVSRKALTNYLMRKNLKPPTISPV